MMNPEALISAINNSIEGKKIDHVRTVTKKSSDGKSTELTTETSHALPLGDEAWKAIVASIVHETLEHLKNNMEIVNGNFSLLNGTMSPTLTGATVSGGPASAIGGTIASETGTASIRPGAVK